MAAASVFSAYLLLALVASATADSSSCVYQHCYKVENDSDLQDALTKAHQHNKSSVEIQLSGGREPFSLAAALNNTLLTFNNWDGFALTGQGEDTVLKCKGDNQGFYFNGSKNLIFRNFTLQSCSRVFVTTSINVTSGPSRDHDDVSSEDDRLLFLHSKSAMVFNSCANLTFDSVQIIGSFGNGLTIYNTKGFNQFLYCQFCLNFLNSTDPYIGGGGVAIETSHCAPGDVACTDATPSVAATVDSSYIFKHCDFTGNRATTHFGSYAAYYPHGTYHMMLGRGGGLSIALNGRAHSNQVLIESCNFMGNWAEFGGGIVLALGDTSVDNSVVVKNSYFEGNGLVTNSGKNRSIGGAVQIAIVSLPSDRGLWVDGYVTNVSGNSIHFVDSTFVRNFAKWGGAVSLSATPNIPGQTRLNTLVFERCSFTQNTAYFTSAAVDISAWRPYAVNVPAVYLTPVFQDCGFFYNQISFDNITNYMVGIGTVYILEIATLFSGINTFYHNQGTAMVVSGTYITVNGSSVMNFTENTGRRGGALAFIGESWMIVGENTRVLFDGNSVGAYGLGGAVYSVRFGKHDFYWQNCFFQYYKFNQPPREWNATFTFRKNSADHQHNSIYTTSIKPCVWSSVGDQLNTNLSMFCVNSTWKFQGEGRNCNNEISTGPSAIKVNSVGVKVFPGWSANLGVIVHDDFGRLLTPVLLASTSRGDISVAKETSYVSNNSIRIYGKENSTSNELLLMTQDPRVIASELRIEVLTCPVGFEGESCRGDLNPDLTCDCKCMKVTPGITCDDNTRESYLLPFNCITNGHQEEDFVVARCPYTSRPKSLYLTDILASQLESKVCGNSSRRGYLCSECEDGYGVSVNRYDYTCVKCQDSSYGWIIWLIIELGPTTVVCFLVVIFGVRLVSPSMNAFLFFSQIVSVQYFYNANCWFFGVEQMDKNLPAPITVLYGVWNLDFFRGLYPSVCLHKGLNTLHILLINYLKAFYPLFILAACYAAIKLYDRQFRIVVLLWKPIQYCLRALHYEHSPSTSIIHAFATLMILSYTKILYVSFPLVTRTTVYTVGGHNSTASNQYYFHPVASIFDSTSFFYFFFGVLALIFVGLAPLFLILYSFQLVQSFISKLGPRLQIGLGTFADSFWGAFRDGTNGDGRNCRWFSGSYLLFRIIIFVVYINNLDWIVQYLIQQVLCTLAIFLFATVRPYKYDVYNFLDISFFSLLAILNSLSFYSSQLVKQRLPLNKVVVYINYLMMYIPLVYLVLLILYRLLLWRGIVKHSVVFNKTRPYVPLVSESVQVEERSYNSEIRLSYSQSEELPDRMIHPELYSSLNPMSTIHSESSDAKEGEEEEEEKGEEFGKALTENSHFLRDEASSQTDYHTVPKQVRFTAP